MIYSDSENNFNQSNRTAISESFSLASRLQNSPYLDSGNNQRTKIRNSNFRRRYRSPRNNGYFSDYTQTSSYGVSNQRYRNLNQKNQRARQQIFDNSSNFLNSSKNSNSKSSRSRPIITSNLGGKPREIENTYFRARSITIIHGTMNEHNQKRRQIQVQISRTNLKNLEQFILDVSESLGLPKWKNDRIRQLYTLKGKRVSQVADIFESDTPLFVALGRENLTISMVKSIVDELQTGDQHNYENSENVNNKFPSFENVLSKNPPKIENAPSTIYTNTTVGPSASQTPIQNNTTSENHIFIKNNGTATQRATLIGSTTPNPSTVKIYKKAQKTIIFRHVARVFVI